MVTGFPNCHGANRKCLPEFFQGGVGMGGNILSHQGIVQFPECRFPAGFVSESPLRLILLDPAIQGIPPDLEVGTYATSMVGIFGIP